MPTRRWSWTGLGLTLLAAAIWGLTPVAVKGALDGYTPELIACVRLAFAAAMLRLIGGRDVHWFVRDPWAWLAGVALGLDFVLYNYGIERTLANLAGIVVNVEIVSTLLLAAWLLGERITLPRAAGCLATLAGVAAIELNDFRWAELMAHQRLVGNCLVMIAGISWSVYAVAQRRARLGRTLLQRLTPIFSVAALTTVPPLFQAPAWRLGFGVWPTLMLLILCVLCTIIVYFVYVWAQELVDVAALSILLASIPLFAVVFAAVLLGETITSGIATGGALVMAGMLIIAVEPAPAPHPRSAAHARRAVASDAT